MLAELIVMAQLVFSGIPDTCKGYMTVEAAAKEALSEALPLQNYSGFEFGGTVYKSTKSGACYTKPYTSGMKYSVGVLIDSTNTIGLFHTHPDTHEDAKVYSAADVRTACKFNVPSFLVTEDGRMYRLDPSPHICGLPYKSQVGKFLGFTKVR